MALTTLHIMHTPLFLGNLRGWEIIIIILAILLLFGANKIPSMMRNVGKGINSFKQGMRDMQEEIKKDPEPKADDSKPAEPKDKQ